MPWGKASIWGEVPDGSAINKDFVLVYFSWYQCHLQMPHLLARCCPWVPSPMSKRRQQQAWGGHRVPFSRRPRLLLEAGRTMKALKQPEHGRGQRGTGRQGEAMQMGTLMWLRGAGLEHCSYHITSVSHSSCRSDQRFQGQTKERGDEQKRGGGALPTAE